MVIPDPRPELQTEIINRLAVIESKLDIALKLLVRVAKEEDERADEATGFGRTDQR